VRKKKDEIQSSLNIINLECRKITTNSKLNISRLLVRAQNPKNFYQVAERTHAKFDAGKGTSPEGAKHDEECPTKRNRTPSRWS
jgi:hypothetical protein